MAIIIFKPSVKKANAGIKKGNGYYWRVEVK